MNNETQPEDNTDNSSQPKMNALERPIFIRLAMLLGKVLPRQTGLNLAAFIGEKLGKDKDSPKVKAVRANQWVIHDQSISDQALDELSIQIFQSAAKCIFDYFYFLKRPEALKKVVDFSPDSKMIFERIWNDQPCVLVCPHLSNFDLMGYALMLYDLKVQVLSFPNPEGTYELQNRLRESLGINVTPMNFNAFRQAKNNLRVGKSILTGLDRPLTGKLQEKYKPTFFGYTTNLPVTYVRIAKDLNVPVFVVSATSQPGNRYLLEVSEPIWMEAKDDLETEILTNANRVLSHAEPILKKYADQWAMFYPIWPQFPGQ
mgnify:CR=1 FL=1